MSQFQTAADFKIGIKGYETNSLFDEGDQVSCISHDCYRKFTLKTEN